MTEYWSINNPDLSKTDTHFWTKRNCYYYSRVCLKRVSQVSEKMKYKERVDDCIHQKYGNDESSVCIYSQPDIFIRVN